jgi:hypothetical protein
MRRRLLAPLVVLVAVLGTASPAHAASRAYLATFLTPAGHFTALIDDPAAMARIDETFRAGSVAIGIPNGVVVRGDGGVNPNHDWHLDDVELADVTTEVCDGTADYVDEHLDEWIDQVGRYCPWGARLAWFRTTWVETEP